MSLETVVAQLARFAQRRQPEALCIKGKWGVGKSYTWSEVLKDLDKTSPSFQRYSYVSLYGLGNINQVRSEIAVSAVEAKDIGERPKLVDILTGKQSLRFLSLARYVPFGRMKEIVDAIEAASFMAVNNYLICIDDLERKGATLSIADVLGLVTYLSDQRECKVCLILNEDALTKEHREEFDRFFEKTFDSHVVFSPTAEESVKIAFRANTPLQAKLRPYCLVLGIANIRVIKKIERLGVELEARITHADVLDRALRTIALLGWAKYNEEKPSLEFIKYFNRLYGAAKNRFKEEEGRWGPLLSKYGYRYLTGLDEVLFKAIENGFFDDDQLQDEARKAARDIEEEAAEEKFHQAWERYHNSFNDDTAELADELISTFRADVRQISPNNASSTIGLLKDIGRAKEATELIELYFRERGKAVLDRSSHFTENDFTEPEFLEAFKKRVTTVEDKRDPANVLEAIAGNQGWGREDVKLLASLTADDFFDLLKRTRGPQLSPMVRTALSLGDTPDGKKVAEAVTRALQRLGGENELNKRRVAKFGIVVP